MNLDAELKKHIVGQDEAIASVVSAIRRSRVGIQVKKHPVSFIFVGSTGVGKTELVKRLASEMFESVESLIRLDMSEYMEKHSVSKIIGSPPGYVGYDEAGQLTEKIRRRPYSVILFDELEKAHPDVLNILLQILDDGRITDAQGRVVNFENTIIIMTSNAGSNQKGGSVGFGRSLTEQSKEKAMKALGEFLRPEFINRVDEIVCFNNCLRFNPFGTFSDGSSQYYPNAYYTDDYLVSFFSITYAGNGWYFFADADQGGATHAIEEGGTELIPLV